MHIFFSVIASFIPPDKRATEGIKHSNYCEQFAHNSLICSACLESSSAQAYFVSKWRFHFEQIYSFSIATKAKPCPSRWDLLYESDNTIVFYYKPCLQANHSSSTKKKHKLFFYNLKYKIFIQKNSSVTPLNRIGMHMLQLPSSFPLFWGHLRPFSSIPPHFSS